MLFERTIAISKRTSRSRAASVCSYLKCLLLCNFQCPVQVAQKGGTKMKARGENTQAVFQNVLSRIK